MNATFKKVISQIFQDVDGMFSSKRVVAAIGTVVLLVAFIADLAFQLTITQFIFDGFLYLVLGALGITAVEPFANRTTTNKVDANIKKTVDVNALPAAEE